MPRSQRFGLSALALSNLLIPIAVLVFATGFFPYKPVLPGLATWEGGEEPGSHGAAVERGGTNSGGEHVPFNKVIFMVVDALRSDFVYGVGSAMEFTQSLIRSGAAIPFTAHASPPTVTMPRVKALTTGSVPSFIDLILNFAESDTSSSLAGQDTWLAQLRARQTSFAGSSSSTDNLVFYGDDTWLKLFPPPFFARADGTTSFFVSDFTEVDLNVTRHLPAELVRNDWSALVLHFLGLDHIGHKTGPQGVKMLPKQKEMDGVIKTIWEAMEKLEVLRDTLLVVAGDHGMNAGGNHGGSGPGETEPALVFASPRFAENGRGKECPTFPREGTEFDFYGRVEQSDLVPTLAGLMGFPVPRNSLGVFIGEMRGFLGGQGEYAKFLSRNAKQIGRIVEATFGEEKFRGQVETHRVRLGKDPTRAGGCNGVAGDEQALACRTARAVVLTGDENEAEALNDFLYAAQDALSSTASSYNIPRMVAGTLLAALSLILAILAFPRNWPPTTAGVTLTFLATLYGIMMFASSYVEEEQHFWYWATPAWLAVLAMKQAQHGGDVRLWKTFSVPRAALAISVLALHRLTIRWNQTGQKHAGAPDIVHAFFPSHHKIMWLLVLATYLSIGFEIVTISLDGILIREAGACVAAVLILAAVVFKLNFTQADAPELVLGLGDRVRKFTESLDLLVQARVMFVVLAMAVVMVVCGALLVRRSGGKKQDASRLSLPARFQPLLTLFLLTQTRASNIPLFLLISLQSRYLAHLRQPTTSTLDTSLTLLLLSQTSYFAFGGSNSISSIDLSNAYNGIGGYNVGAVGLLVFVGNWAGSVWWAGAAVGLLRGARQIAEDVELVKGDMAVNDNEAAKERAWVAEERKRLHNNTLAATKSSPSSTPTSAQLQVHHGVWTLHLAAMTGFVSASLVAVMAACTALRTHLFIWTVFSPKYLYSMAWAVGWHLGVNVGMGSLLWWLGGVT